MDKAGAYRNAASMSLLELISAGVVLTPAVPDPVRFLLAPVAVVNHGRLYFYDLAGERARSLKFEGEDWENERLVWLVQAGDRVASLALVADASAEAQFAWQRHWLDQSTVDRARLHHHFRAALNELLG